MRFLTFESKGTQRPGLLAEDGRIVDLTAALTTAREQGALSFEGPIPGGLLGLIQAGDAFLHAAEALSGLAKDGELEDASLDPDACRLLAPIPRPAKNVFCVGRNYAAHVSEGYKARKMKQVLPEHPQFFTKPPTAVTGPDAAIRLDPDVTQKLDYEVELAVVIGRRGRDIPAAEADSYIFGYTIANDVTARDLQRRHDRHPRRAAQRRRARHRPHGQRRGAPRRQYARPDLSDPGHHRNALARHDPGARRHHLHGHALGRHGPAAVPEGRRRGHLPDRGDRQPDLLDRR
jgi:2-keto-4-pentenoate hydratase/2-oxohepta-3-ene-1,7-dioic acid hydratase in catechol pathway